MVKVIMITAPGDPRLVMNADDRDTAASGIVKPTDRETWQEKIRLPGPIRKNESHRPRRPMGDGSTGGRKSARCDG